MISKNEIDDFCFSLQKVKEKLKQIPNSLELENRLFQLNLAIEVLESRFSNKVIIFLDQRILVDLKNHLASLINTIESCIKSGASNLQSFISSTENFINKFSSHFVYLPYLTNDDTPKVLSIYETFAQQTENTILKYEKKITELNNKVIQLETSRQNIEQSLNDGLTTIKNTSEKQEAQFKQKEEEWSQLFSNKLKENDTQFANAKKQINEENEKIKLNAKIEFDKQFEEIKKTYESYNNQLEEDLKKTKEACDEKLKEIEKILAISGNTALSGVSAQHANRCGKSAKNLFCISLVLMIIGAIVLILFSWNLSELRNITIGAILFRLSFVILIFLPAFYCACEAKRKNDKEQFYRDFSIKVATIPPYLNGVNVNEKGDLSKVEEEKLILLHHLITESKFKSTKGPVVIPKDVLNLVSQLTKLTNQTSK